MAELSVADVKELMSRFSYKPNFTFRVVEVLGDLVMQVDMDTVDSTPRKRGKIAIDAARPVIPEEVLNDGEHAFWQWLHDDVIGFVEHHEMDEWFQIDGKPLYGPHNPPLTEWAEKQTRFSMAKADGLLTPDAMAAKLASLSEARKTIEDAVHNVRQSLHDGGLSWEAIEAMPGLQPIFAAATT